MQVIDAIVDRTGLTEVQAREVLDVILDFGIPLYSIEELDGWYSDFEDLKADSRRYDNQVLAVSYAVEFDRKPMKNGEIL